MKKHCPNNIKIFLIIFLLLGVYTINFTVNIDAENIYKNSSQNFNSQTSKIISSTESQNNIKVTDVTGGFGLKIN